MSWQSTVYQRNVMSEGSRSSSHPTVGRCQGRCHPLAEDRNCRGIRSEQHPKAGITNKHRGCLFPEHNCTWKFSSADADHTHAAIFRLLAAFRFAAAFQACSHSPSSTRSNASMDREGLWMCALGICGRAPPGKTVFLIAGVC